MVEVLSGNEAIARGVYEAGCKLAAAYPGTPSTEILENIREKYKDIDSRWASNEKVALEIAAGASIGGLRSIAVMKHVGLNVAADPFFTMGYAGVNGGFIIVTADDPACHSSQNEQDNRLYAPHAKVAMIEPSDSQEAKDFIADAYYISEKFDLPVLFRVTTRICHSKSLVALKEGRYEQIKPYVTAREKYAMLPATARRRHAIREELMIDLEKYSNKSPLNRIEWGESKDIGVITSGISYQYAREAFGDKASYLKLGLTNPLPSKLISTFCRSVNHVVVIEENEPYLENKVKSLQFDCIGKERIPLLGELNANIVRKAFLSDVNAVAYNVPIQAPGRPPVLCAGCPHRGFFRALQKRKKDIVAIGDIGCYALGVNDPFYGFDVSICMGAGFSVPIGMAKAFEMNGDKRKVFGMLGDSTFFHSGMTGLVDVVHSNSNVVLCLLDNEITAMTGHQYNPGTKMTLMGEPAKVIDPVSIVRATGLDESRIKIVNPINVDEMDAAVDEGIKTAGPFVIVAKYPCALIKEVARENAKKYCEIDQSKCKKCKACLKIACPAIAQKDGKIIIVDKASCTACGLCMQLCKFGAIEKVGG